MQIVGEKGTAIRTYDLIIVAHIDKNVGMIERRQVSRAHKFLRANTHSRNTGIVVKIGDAVRNHFLSDFEKLCAVLARH